MTMKVERSDGVEIELADELAAVYAFVKRFHSERQYCPSLREIVEATPAGSTSVAASYVDRLAAFRLLRRERGITRTIRPA